MLRKFALAFACLTAWSLFGQQLVNDCNSCIVVAQTGGAAQPSGTPHGIGVTITPPATIGGSGVIQGYFLFRCPGNTCTASSATGWVSVTGLIPAASQAGTTFFLDPASGLATNTTYGYEAETVDSNGNFSAFAATVAVVAVTTFPTNPQAPTVATKVQ